MKQELRARRRLKRQTIVVMTALSVFLIQTGAYAESSSGYSASVSVSSSASPVMPDFEQPAKPKITKDEAVAKVKSLFPILADAQVQDVQLGSQNRYPPGNPNVWTIQWNYTKGNSSYGFSSLVDSLTGELLQTSIGYPFDQGNQVYYPPKVSRAEALRLAKAFIGKASPSLPAASLEPVEQMKFNKQPLFGPVRYDFNFTVSVNGIRATAESIYLSMDGNGQITSYNRNKVTGAYPPAIPKVTAEQAREKYFESAELALQYFPVYNYADRDKTWFLGWAPLLQTEMSVDAQTGDILNGFGEAFNPKDVKYIDIPAASIGFTPIKGTGEDSLLTAEQAAAAVLKAVKIPENRNLTSSILDTYNGGVWGGDKRQTWRLQWTEQTKAPTPYGPSSQTMAVVDARTGQLLDFRMDAFRPPLGQPQDQDKPQIPINKEQAKTKAMQLIGELYPDAHSELKWLDPDPNAMYKEPQDFIPFVFQRMYNGRPVVDDRVTLSLDAANELIGYTASRTNNLEKTAGALTAQVTKEKAAQLYREQMTQTLQYRVYGDFYTEKDYVKPKIKLVYTSQNKKPADFYNNVLDASSGKWRALFADADTGGDGPMVYPQDINGHWAQKDLEALVQYQVLKTDASGKLNPDGTLTLGDWMNMMAYAVNPNYASYFNYNAASDVSAKFKDVDVKSPYYAASQWFIQNNWLDPVKTPVLKPEQPLTREQLAESIVSIIKYNKLSDYLKQSLPFKDTNQIANKGAVTIAVSLGLFSRNAELFQPKNKVTKAQAATVMMKLVHLQGKLDQRIAN